VEYIMERGATRVVMGEREIASSMLQILQDEMTQGEDLQPCDVMR